MAAITEAQLSAKIKAVLDLKSGDPEVNIEEARQSLADELAQAIAQFVQARTTIVTGTSATGGAVTGTGIIQ